MMDLFSQCIIHIMNRINRSVLRIKEKVLTKKKYWNVTNDIVHGNLEKPMTLEHKRNMITKGIKGGSEKLK